MARVLAVLVLLAAACGGSSSSSDGELLPFADVQASDFVFEADPGDPNRGIFRVTTTEPMICTIVWGETEAFGNFNNSLAMNGTGIIDHDVILPGATAGTTYFFRVQGSTADGSQYRSEVGTFTIPEIERAAAPAVDRGPNLALDAVAVEASSVFGAGWEAENAIDGDLSTEWATRGDGDEGFIAVDLGSPQDIAGVEFVTRSMADGSAITEQFTVTVDGGETVGPFPAGNPADPRYQAVEVTGQVVRFDIDASTGGNVGAIEVAIYSQ